MKRYQIHWVAAGATVLILLDLYVIFAVRLTPDYHIFWRAGRDLWEGLDPYDPGRFSASPFLHPPTALPVFAVFATLPYLPSLVIWSLLNVLICWTLPTFAVRVLSFPKRNATPECQGPSVSRALPQSVLMVLSLALIVSDAFGYGLFTGQLGLLTTLMLYAALDSQGRQRPVTAGIWLGLASIKISTMLPFLLLFLRRSDLRTWLALILTCSVLCVLAGPLGLLPKRVSFTLQRIGEFSAPGQVNDYSFAGTQSTNMIGFDHALYRLGLRDRAIIRMLQVIAVFLVGLWVMWQVLASRLPRPAACSLVALYSVIFFYHRIYDTVVLVLPLTYSVSRARMAEGRSRWWFVTGSIAILLVLFFNGMGIKALTEASLKWGLWGRLVQATVTAYATWMILLAMACIFLGDVRSVRPAAHSFESG